MYSHSTLCSELSIGTRLIVSATANELSAGIAFTLPSGDPDSGLLHAHVDDIDPALPKFVEAIARHRHHGRETDPPFV